MSAIHGVFGYSSTFEFKDSLLIKKKKDHVRFTEYLCILHTMQSARDTEVWVDPAATRRSSPPEEITLSVLKFLAVTLSLMLQWNPLFLANQLRRSENFLWQMQTQDFVNVCVGNLCTWVQGPGAMYKFVLCWWRRVTGNWNPASPFSPLIVWSLTRQPLKPQPSN